MSRSLARGGGRRGLLVDLARFEHHDARLATAQDSAIADCSKHLALLAENGFSLVGVQRVTSPSRLATRDLAPRGLDDEDLTTSGAFIQARAVAAGHGATS